MSPIYVPERPQEYLPDAAMLGRNLSTRLAPPFTNGPRAAGGQNLGASPWPGVMIGTHVWLPAGVTISNITMFTRATAGATLTNRWAAIYTIGAAALARQSTTNTGATMAANTQFDFALSSSYTTPAEGLYPVGIMIAGTTPPTFAGFAAGNAPLSQPTFSGFTQVPYGWSNGSGLTTTAPAGPLTLTAIANAIQVFLW